MTQLKIDNARKTIDVELLLEGEKDPITIHIPHYSLVPDATDPTLTITSVSISRPWMNQLAAELLASKPLAIPPHLAKLLRLVL